MVTPSSNVTTSHHEALRLLQAVVVERHAAGRRTIAAGLKPVLQRRSVNTFSEGSLGFPTFRSFLQDAARKGVIRLRPTLEDYEVLPPGDDPIDSAVTGARSLRRREPRPRVRPDLWRAFVDWRQGWKRVYDIEQDRAVMFPEATPEAGDAPEYAHVRQAWLANPDAFREITPITQNDQLTWMQEFSIADPDPAMRLALQTALATESPLRAFTNTVRTNTASSNRWHAERLRRVAEVIRGWASENSLEVQIFQKREMPESFATHGDTPEWSTLRQKVHVAVDRMPVADLLRLSIPIEYIIDE
jgi:hypothetical protein